MQEEGEKSETHLWVGPLWGEVCDGAESRRELGGGEWWYVDWHCPLVVTVRVARHQCLDLDRAVTWELDGYPSSLSSPSYFFLLHPKPPSGSGQG